ncbi:Afadin and alpha-actinin-binding domain-containing protein [Trichoderma aethiopicum]
MIDAENLRTASLYINNQLLSRGLLRDGQEIDFADCGRRGYFGTADSASRIIGILNDLLIRRDRDAEQRDSLSTAVRSLRAENLKHTSDIVRLTEKCADAQRRSDIAATSEAALKTQLKSAESVVKGLKDELARTKGLVAQLRASCATEMRRRDRQIETLKKQVGEAGRARGTRSSSGVLSITVTGDVGNEERRSPAQGGNIEDTDYSLRSESNAFLATLAQNLSEENEALLRIMQQAKDQLREMSGWTGGETQTPEVVKPQGWEEIAAELGAVMDHMRTILTNPSFVPIEEVMVREEEIDRLRKGFVKMESRWEDAVHLMDGWRKRMAKNGRPVGQDDIRMGLHLSPVRVPDVEETRAAGRHDLSAVQEESEDEMRDCEEKVADPEQDMYGYSDEEATVASDDEEDDVEAIEHGAEELDHHISGTEEAEDVQQMVEPGAHTDPSHQGPLQNSNSAGNRGSQQTRFRQKPIGSAAITARGAQATAGPASSAEAARQTVGRVTAIPPDATQRLRPVPTRAANADERIRIGSTTSLDEVLLSNDRRENNRPEEHAASSSGHAMDAAAAVAATPSMRANPRRVPVRLAQARPARPQDASPSKTAIAVKLAAAEKQAAAARNRAKLRALRSSPAGAQRSAGTSAAEPSATRQTAARIPGPVRRASPVVKREAAQPEAENPEKRKRDRRAAKVSSRRRSTLSPFELQSLMSGNVE